MTRYSQRITFILPAVAFAVMALAACSSGPAVPAEDYETRILGTIRQGQEKQVEEEYEAGDRIRGVIFAGIAKQLEEGRVDLDRGDLASAERGGVTDIHFRIVTDTGEAIMDLGVVPSRTEFEFVVETGGSYFFIFENTATGIEKLKAFSMGVNRVTSE